MRALLPPPTPCCLGLMGAVNSTRPHPQSPTTTTTITHNHDSPTTATKPNQVPDALTSSMVDDAFYILKKCGSRALATGSVQCVAALLGELNDLLANSYKVALQVGLDVCFGGWGGGEVFADWRGGSRGVIPATRRDTSNQTCSKQTLNHHATPPPSASDPTPHHPPHHHIHPCDPPNPRTG